MSIRYRFFPINLKSKKGINSQGYRAALEMSPSSVRLLLNLGSVHHAMGDWELAGHHYRRCLELEPNNQVVIANMKLLGSQLLNNH